MSWVSKIFNINNGLNLRYYWSGSVVGTLFPVGLPWVELGGVGLHLVILVDLQWVGFCRDRQRWFSEGGFVMGTLFHGPIKNIH